MPEEKMIAGPHFLRRHSSLWEKGGLSPGLDVLCENDTDTTNPWERPVRAPIVLPFEEKNVSEGAQSINPLEGDVGGEDEDLHAATAGGHIEAGLVVRC